MRRGALTAALCAVFFFSGAAALIFETLWFRLAGLQLGNSVWTSSIVLAAFMCGLALGNALASRYGATIVRPLLFYAVMEAVVAVSSLAVILSFPHLTPVIVPLVRLASAVPGGVNLLRLSVAFLAILLPATAMGTTLPLLSKALARCDASFGSVLGRLYGWNTLGAVAGVLTAELALIRSLGITLTALAAASLNIVACVVALLLTRHPLMRQAEALEPGTPRGLRALPSPALRALTAAALVGGAVLALEVVWFRFIQLFVFGTTLSFASMLAVILTGIGLGGLVASSWLRRSEPRLVYLPLIALVAGVATQATYSAFTPTAYDVASWPLDLSRSLILSLRLMLPTTFLSGVLFTLYGHVLRRHCGEETETAGLLTLFNTLGATLGALLAGLLMLPLLGVERSLFALTLVFGVAALLTSRGFTRGRERWVLLGVAVLSVVYFAAFPFGLMTGRHLRRSIDRFLQEAPHIVAFREGLNETITLLRREWGGRPLFYRLVTNGYSMSGTLFREDRYMKLFVYWPTALRPESRSALLISYGLGTTASALQRSRRLESIDVVDTSRDIVDLGDLVFPPGQRPLRDPRFHVHIEDARFYLLTTESRYDLITAEPPPPKGLGIINLYTREFFQLIRGRLNPGGLATYWLPVDQLTEQDCRSITRAFCDVFDDCSLWRGAAEQWILAGSSGGLDGPSAEAFRSLWEDPETGPDLVEIGVEVPEQLGALFIADQDELLAFSAGTPPLVDDHPGRLARESPDAEEIQSLFDWASTREAALRFAGSPLITHVWPESLRRDASPFFEYERDIDDLLRDRLAGRRLTVLDRVLRASHLRTLPLLLMGSDPRVQAIAHQADAAGIRAPGVSMELGIGHMARREYSQAARRFQDAWQQEPAFHAAAFSRALALFFQGRHDQASAVLARIDPERMGARTSWWEGEAGHAWLAERLHSAPSREALR